MMDIDLDIDDISSNSISSVNNADSVASMASISHVARNIDSGNTRSFGTTNRVTASSVAITESSSENSMSTVTKESSTVLVSISNNSDPIVKISQVSDIEERSKVD